jgi:uncharacterized protein YlxW (UPF0749 family)
MLKSNSSTSADFESTEDYVRKDSTKIYFFLIAISALLFTNIYFYVKYKSGGQQVIEMSTEKMYMQSEIDRIEAELDRLSIENIDIGATLAQSRDSVRTLIQDLRIRLEQNQFTREELALAQTEINTLRTEVYNYRDDLELIRKENERLAQENTRLTTLVDDQEENLNVLQTEKANLNEQLMAHAMTLKTSNIQVAGFKQRSGDRLSTEVKAKSVDLMRIDFTFEDNALMPSGMVNVFVRIIDPSGNLRVMDANNMALIGGKEMQYTFKTQLNFTNKGETYHLEWVDPKGFQKGLYNVGLYCDHSLMGREMLVLK